MRQPTPAALLVVLGVLAGCGDSNDDPPCDTPECGDSADSGTDPGAADGGGGAPAVVPPGGGGSTQGTVDPYQACEDLLDAAVDGGVRCGFAPRQQLLVDFEEAFECGKVQRITDPRALHDICIPWYASASCDDLLNGLPPEVCTGQLNY